MGSKEEKPENKEVDLGQKYGWRDAGPKVHTALEKDEENFQVMVNQMRKGEQHPGMYLQGRGALGMDDLRYLREVEASQLDSTIQRERDEKVAFAAAKARAEAEANACEEESLALAAARREKLKRASLQAELLKSRVAIKPKKAPKMPRTSAGAVSADGVTVAETCGPLEEHAPDAADRNPQRGEEGTAQEACHSLGKSSGSTDDHQGTKPGAEAPQSKSAGLVGLISYGSSDEDSEES
eukprot:jgi/Mesvir1/13969/Mv12432-RA.1